MPQLLHSSSYRQHQLEQLIGIPSLEGPQKDMTYFHNSTMIVHYQSNVSDNISASRSRYETHPLRNGTPRLQPNWYPPTFGVSVETRFALHLCTSLGNAWLAKSRGSTGNILPPISKARVWGSEHGKTPSVPRWVYMSSTTSDGPRKREFPCRREYLWGLGIEQQKKNSLYQSTQIAR